MTGINFESSLPGLNCFKEDDSSNGFCLYAGGCKNRDRCLRSPERNSDLIQGEAGESPDYRMEGGRPRI